MTDTMTIDFVFFISIGIYGIIKEFQLSSVIFEEPFNVTKSVKSPKLLLKNLILKLNFYCLRKVPIQELDEQCQMTNPLTLALHDNYQLRVL